MARWLRETDTSDIYCYRDTKALGVADEKTLFHKGGPQTTNLEHQASGLIWNIDNWIYSLYHPYRYRWRDGQWQRERDHAGGGTAARPASR